MGSTLRCYLAVPTLFFSRFFKCLLPSDMSLCTLWLLRKELAPASAVLSTYYLLFLDSLFLYFDLGSAMSMIGLLRSTGFIYTLMSMYGMFLVCRLAGCGD